MKSADIARELGITEERLNSIKAEHRPVEKYKKSKEEQMMMVGGMMKDIIDQGDQDRESDMAFEYDLSRFNQLKDN